MWGCCWTTLAARLQTRVYLYLLVRAGHEINGGRPLAPEQVGMVYWFADHPSRPTGFGYAAARFRADGAYLASLIEEVSGLGDNDFEMTSDGRRCRACRYAPLCDRDAGAGDDVVSLFGSEDPDDTGLNPSFDLEQIAEIEY